MNLPSYYLARPEFDLTPAIRNEFDRLFERSVQAGDGSFIDWSLEVPKWLFLCYLGDHKDVLLHGSGNSEITEFEPRQSDDAVEFGNQKAVYASSDALWSIYFAVMDRDRYRMSLVNYCFRLIAPDGESVPYYYFSINSDALVHKPWRPGVIYILPRQTFERQGSGLPDRESAQWRSFEPVKPMAKILVEPSDFPFLDEVRGHDPAVVRERAISDPDGFPWLDE